MYPVRREVSFSSTDFNLVNHVFSENDDLLLRSLLLTFISWHTILFMKLSDI
jgi:hypothetical protein